MSYITFVKLTVDEGSEEVVKALLPNLLKHPSIQSAEIVLMEDVKLRLDLTKGFPAMTTKLALSKARLAELAEERQAIKLLQRPHLNLDGITIYIQPNKAKKINHADAMELGRFTCGVLPTVNELKALMRSFPEQFKEDKWYWTSTVGTSPGRFVVLMSHDQAEHPSSSLLRARFIYREPKS